MEIIQKIKNQQQEEQNQLLKTILNWRFFYPWKNVNEYQDERSLAKDANLELFITSTCNQKCEYCYLQKYPDLYPAEYNDPKLILHNLDILLKYFYSNNFHFPAIDLYSAEIWHSQFGRDVLELLYKYIKMGLSVEWIIIASNCSFVSNPKSLQAIQQYIDKFNAIQVPLVFSISIDGKIIDNTVRPRNDKNLLYTDEFYDLIAAFAQHNHFLFHPMVSPESVALWKENYKWWTQYCEKIGYDVSDAIMMLEVRDGIWTKQNMQDYCEFIKVLLDEFLYDTCHGDTRLFCNSVLNCAQPNEPHLSGYIPWAVAFNDTFAGCTVANHLTIRLGDLAICPCHRTSYNEYLYGKFIVENDTIIDIEAINPVLAIHILMSNSQVATPLCANCALQYCCLRGCYGSQIEYGKDPCFPITNVCEFFKTKISFILKYYKEHGILDYCKTFQPNMPGSVEALRLLQTYQRLMEERDDLEAI